MIADRVVSEDDLRRHLESRDFVPTGYRCATGEFWRSKKTGKHLLVPDSWDGFYPNWMLTELEAIVGKISPGSIPGATH